MAGEINEIMAKINEKSRSLPANHPARNLNMVQSFAMPANLQGTGQQSVDDLMVVVDADRIQRLGDKLTELGGLLDTGGSVASRAATAARPSPAPTATSR